nr:hypothetical protein [Pandoravirus aubagnensis]
MSLVQWPHAKESAALCENREAKKKDGGWDGGRIAPFFVRFWVFLFFDIFSLFDTAKTREKRPVYRKAASLLLAFFSACCPDKVVCVPTRPPQRKEKKKEGREKNLKHKMTATQTEACHSHCAANA